MDNPFRSQGAPGHAQWEYRKITLDWASIGDWESMLNGLGREGWELATSIVPPPVYAQAFSALPIVVLMKRAV
jgi:hypothetical protein